MQLIFVWLGLLTFLCCAMAYASLSKNLQPRHSRASVSIFAATVVVPPWTLFFITTTFLLNGHPTAQFNGGNEEAMQWWSWWVHWFPGFVMSAEIQMIAYALLTLVALIIKPMRRYSLPFTVACICAVYSLFVLGLASPSA